jgi:hypothetical protein
VSWSQLQISEFVCLCSNAIDQLRGFGVEVNGWPNRCLHRVTEPVGESHVQPNQLLKRISLSQLHKQQVEAQHDPAQLPIILTRACNMQLDLKSPGLQALHFRLIRPSKLQTRQHLKFRCNIQMEGDA